MSENATSRMKADKNLEVDLAKATSFEEIQQLLSNATERSGIAYRNPDTGRFEQRNPLTPASQTVDPNQPEEKTFSKIVNIGGQDFEFSASSELELEQNIRSANEIASAAQTQAARQAATASTTPRAKTQAERERELGDRAELELKFRRGELTTVEFLERTNAIGEYLASKNFDVEAAGAAQFEKSWSDATAEFLASSDWPGNSKNLELVGQWIMAHNMMEAPDKVAALRACYADLKEKGLLFEGEYTPQQLEEMTSQMSPQAILEEWKAAHGGDPSAANDAFMRQNSSTGSSSSSLFGK